MTTATTPDGPTGTDPETGLELDEGSAAYIAAKKARANAVDGADGAHGGGLGATGSAVDFEKPANFAGIDDKGL